MTFRTIKKKRPGGRPSSSVRLSASNGKRGIVCRIYLPLNIAPMFPDAVEIMVGEREDAGWIALKPAKRGWIVSRSKTGKSSQVSLPVDYFTEPFPTREVPYRIEGDTLYIHADPDAAAQPVQLRARAKS